MARFLTALTKKYSPYDIDYSLFAMHVSAPRSIPIVCSSMIAEDGYGEATVNGVKISKGKCVKFDFAPFPIYMLPVGEVATEFDKEYVIKLTVYKSINGSKFASKTFKIKTASEKKDSGKYAVNEQAAKYVSDEGIVLMDNDGTLPLTEGSKVALLGEYQNFRISAIGASFIKPRWTLSIEQAIARSSALAVSNDANVALYFISRDSSENRDNRPVAGGYYLTEAEKEGLKKAVDRYDKVVLILNTGYPVEMKYIKSLGLSAIIWTGFSGQRGAESLIDIISGKVNPSGRLADTWSYDYYDAPSSHNFINLDENTIYSDDGKKYGVSVYYEEKQYVGYRYYDSYGVEVAYPFGHGLSYTQFDINAKAEYTGDNIHVDATVKNIGKCMGKNAVLVYVQSPIGRLNKPKRVLCGFDKTRIVDVKDSQQISIDIPIKDFAVYDDSKSAFVLEKGNYIVYVGGSIRDAKAIYSFDIDSEIVVENTIKVCAPLEDVGSIDMDGKVKERSIITNAKECIAIKAERKAKPYTELAKYNGSIITLQDIKKDIAKLDDFVSQFTIKELVDFTVCNGSCWQQGKNGAAGKLAHSDRLGVPTLYMSDGNCGVNINALTTGFPSSNLLAGTFNKELAYKVGEVLADESKEHGIAINLGPGGNLHRNILCGRHPEYYSEDPILTGTLMAYQAKGQEENGVLATYKHLFANHIELERKSAHGIIDERTVRELYLRVFDKALSLYKPSCVMTSYNPVNGIYPSENSDLLNDLLRQQWGFDGFVMTDWDGYDTADCLQTVNAGTNLLTPGNKKHYRMVLKAVKNGVISKATLQHSVKQIIKVLVKCI